MILLFSPTVFFGVFIFLLAATAFVLAVRFFMASRKRLNEAFPNLISSYKFRPFGYIGSLFSKSRKKKPESVSSQFQKPRQATLSVIDIKRTRHLQWQQNQVQNFSLVENNKSAQIETASIRRQRDEEERLMQREKTRKTENQAWQITELTMKLEHAEQLQSQLETTLLKKEEKLYDLASENQELYDLVNDLQEKLSQSALQRQQLLRQIKSLEDISTAMQAADSVKRLKAETTRTAELKSKIELMAESR